MIIIDPYKEKEGRKWWEVARWGNIGYVKIGLGGVMYVAYATLFPWRESAPSCSRTHTRQRCGVGYFCATEKLF